MTFLSKRPLVAWSILALAVLAGCGTLGTPGSSKKTVDKMYVMYCGEAKIADVSPWTGGPPKPFEFSDNCYLIQHGGDWMIWDTGFADALASVPGGSPPGRGGMRAFRKKTLAAQLQEIGVKPSDIKYLAFSHTHSDHVGNGNLFTAATLYIQEAEYDAAFGPDPQKFGFQPATYDQLKSSKVVKLHGDYDVFGDGSVTILSTPGHTPGHQSLLVRLPKTGPVVLSGDVAHFKENFDNRRAPSFNFNVEQSKASIDRVNDVLRTEHATLWINHDAAQTATIPHAPQFVQ
jgi:glyoxylase-like metal-dependent hydrolase (beta-lactamase superfamily II)